jgi:hypothetical protein
MKNFLDIYEYTYKEFCSNFKAKDLDYMAPDQKFDELFQSDGKIWVSDREGEDAWVIPKDELEFWFEEYLRNVNHSMIQQALQLQKITNY